MSNFQEGYSYAETLIGDEGYLSALDYGIVLRRENGRLDMFTVGYRTAISVHFEKMFGWNLVTDG